MNLHLLRTYYRYYRRDLAYFSIAGCLVITWLMVVAIAISWEEKNFPPIWISWGVLPLLLMLVLVAMNTSFIVLAKKIAAGFYAIHRGRYAEAETLLREAMILAEALGPPDDPCRAEVLKNWTLLARMQGDYDRAESYCQQWLGVQEKAWGLQHPRTLDVLEELAEIYLEIAHYSQARDVLQRALQGRTAHENTAPVPLAVCQGMLGKLWIQLGRFDQAEPYFRQALSLLRPYRVSRPREWRATVLNLADCCTQLGAIDEAGRLCQKALEQAQRLEGQESIAVASCLHQLASIRHALKLLEQAEEIVRRSLSMLHKLREDNRLLQRKGLQLLATILRDQGKWAEAEACYRESLQLCEQYLAPIHPVMASVLEEYAVLLERMGRDEEAQNCQQRAKQIRDFHSPFRLV
jgi:tetratricopeptide (TPR) repeat protein